MLCSLYYLASPIKWGISRYMLILFFDHDYQTSPAQCNGNKAQEMENLYAQETVTGATGADLHIEQMSSLTLKLHTKIVLIIIMNKIHIYK